MRQYRADNVVRLPDLESTAGLEDACGFVEDSLGRCAEWNDHAQIFHNHNVELVIVEGEG